MRWRVGTRTADEDVLHGATIVVTCLDGATRIAGPVAAGTAGQRRPSRACVPGANGDGGRLMPGASSPPVPAFFLSDSTGISAETMGNALLIQFPDLHFERRLIPFISSVEEARRVVVVLDDAMAGPVTPLAFSATAVTEIRDEVHRAELLYRSHRIPMINSSAKSAEEMSTVILQSLKHN